MMRVTLLAIILFLFAESINAKKIDAVMSHTYFFAPDPSQPNAMLPYLELSWQVNPHSVHFYTTPEKTIVGRIKVAINIWSDSGIIKNDVYFYETTPKTDVGGLETLNMIDLKRYFITYGFIKLQFTISDDKDSTSFYKETDTFTISKPEKRVFFSEPQIIDTIIISEANTPFRKNGKQKIPHCVNFLDDKTTILQYYSEMYGADAIATMEYPLIRKAFISSRMNSTPLSSAYLKTDTVRQMPQSNVSGSFNIESLQSGNYYLITTVENRVHQILASNNYFFQRLNKHPKIDTAKKNYFADTSVENIKVLDLSKTFVAKYDLGQVKAILKMLLPVSDQLGMSTIRGFLKNPDEIYMRYFIYNYFLARNAKEPAQAWQEYSDKVIETNNRFNFRKSPGYETDRGAVFLRYGEPSERLTIENENGTLPYEIWQYNNLTAFSNQKDLANAVFLFYKPNDMADYKLLHSTVDGETQNLSWRTFLYVSDGAGNSINSRAEQYLGNR